MSFWSGEALEARGDEIISDFDPGRIDCNSYRLVMGDQYYCTSDARRSIWDGSTRQTLRKDESFAINPGQFGFLITKECLTLPNDAMAFISMRSGVKFRGLINVSGFHVDPGYKGKLIFSVFNAGPSNVHIHQGEEIFLVWFASLSNTGWGNESEKLRDDPGHKMIPTTMINGMSREVISLSALQSDITSVKSTQRLHTIIFGAFSALLLATIIGGGVYMWQQGFQSILQQHNTMWQRWPSHGPGTSTNAPTSGNPNQPRPASPTPRSTNP